MSKLLGAELPDDLYERLCGRRPEAYSGKAIILVTVDAEGLPHPSMLSHYEVAARDRRNVALAVYATTATAENLRRRGRATLLIIDERLACYVKCVAEETSGGLRSSPHNAGFNLRIAQVLADAANEEYEAGAYVAGGVTYHSPDPAAEAEQGRAVLKELLEAGGAENQDREV